MKDKYGKPVSGTMRFVIQSMETDKRNQRRAQLTQKALSNTEISRLPREIQTAVRDGSWSQIAPEHAEMFRYLDRAQFWWKDRKGWRKGNCSEYQSANERYLLVLTTKSASDARRGSAYSAGQLTGFDATAASQSQQLSHQIWLNDFFTRTSDRCYAPVPTVFISSPDHRATVFLEESPHTYRHFEEHQVQPGDTAESIAERYTGVADPHQVYGYNPGTSAKRPLEEGEQLRLATGWEVRIQGSTSNSQQVTLNWQGPVSGRQTIDIPPQPRDERFNWHTQLHLPPGDYHLTATADTATHQQSFRVEEVKELQFGVFFDGTGNNYNVDQQCKDDDFEPTNIAKLYELYPQINAEGIGKVYVKGVGTREASLFCLPKDVDPGYVDYEMAFGLTIGSKMDEAFESLKLFLKVYEKTYSRINLTFDIFGFSRGAATARAFINKLHEIKKNYNYGVWSQSTKIKVRFCGLFDTVGSIGSPGDEDNLGFNLNLDYTSAVHVYQIAAYNEYREYFPLTSLYSPEGKMPSPYFKEETLWGAHSDIGGGYGGDHIERKIYLEKFWVTSLNFALQRKQMTEVYQRLTYWREQKIDLGGEVEIENSPDNSDGVFDENFWVYIVWKRQVKKQLAFLALEKMHNRAQNCFVPLFPLSDLGLKQLEFEIPTQLTRIHNLATKGDKDALKQLERDYIHHSHSLVTPPGSLVNSNKPENNPLKTAPNEKREIFYNHHKKART